MRQGVKGEGKWMGFGTGRGEIGDVDPGEGVMLNAWVACS